MVQNGGVCRDSVASLYKCSCPRGFTGSNCQHLSSEHCHPGNTHVPCVNTIRCLDLIYNFFVRFSSSEACGPDATCINRPSGVGYDCRCHLGKFGHKCMDGKDSFFRTLSVEILPRSRVTSALRLQARW